MIDTLQRTAGELSVDLVMSQAENKRRKTNDNSGELKVSNNDIDIYLYTDVYYREPGRVN